MIALETALKRERRVVAAGLLVLTFLAWAYIWLGAGMGMTSLAMTHATLFPHLAAVPMSGMPMPAVSWLTVVMMWWVMMIAMMTPSAAPLLLLYGRVMRHAGEHSGRRASVVSHKFLSVRDEPVEPWPHGKTRTSTNSVRTDQFKPPAQQDTGGQAPAIYVPTAFLALGYLLAWFGFSVVASLMQFALQRTGLISDMMLWSQSAVLSAAVLAAAGLYQLTPLKLACLKQCRNPAQFLSHHMRQGRIGALRLGTEHGIWCLGCCWLLMLLLFVGGVMNAIWIALLAMLVLIEKIAPRGVLASRIAGIALLTWAIVTLLV